MPWLGKTSAPRSSFSEYAPSGLCDLHAHVLPGIDDGARSVDESVVMLRGLSRLGFVLVVSTPHVRFDLPAPDVARQRALISSIVKRWDAKAPGSAPPRIETGAETLFDDRFLDAEAAGRIPSVGPAGTYLVELGFAMGTVPVRVEEVAFRFQVAGKQLMLAHPERSFDLRKRPERLTTLHRGGVLLQLDLMSLIGRHGRGARETALRLLAERRYDLAATDIHREADLGDVERALRALVSRDAAEFERLLSTNPRRVLAGEPAEVFIDE
jgi:protein-tyrosine phosphatase